MSDSYVDIGLRMNGREIFTAAEAPAAASEQQRTLLGGRHAFSKTLGPTTTPALSEPLVSQEITIPGGGSVTLDLTAIAALALPGSATRTVDLTGAKLKALLIRTHADNDDAGVNIAPGASNPYPMFGTGNDITLYPDSQLCLAFRATEPPAGIPAVAGAVKTLDITGTEDDVVWIELYFGT